MKVAAVCGQLNSGKGVVSDILVKEHGYVSMGFADPLKRILQQMFYIPDDVLWGPSPKRSGKVRDMLQELGTDFGRKYDPDVWVNLTVKRLEHWKSYGEDLYGLLPYVGWEDVKNVVMSDLRFPNEAEALHDHFGYNTRLFKVVRPGNFDALSVPDKNRVHESENVIDDIEDKHITAVISNNKDLDHLHDIARTTICTYL
jgi:hypothetical protein